VASDGQGARDLHEAGGVARDWSAYVETRYGVRVSWRQCPVPLDRLIATQPEIELLKYRLVRDEGFRIEEPIVVYKGRAGPYYVVDGHTRARVRWDAGCTTVEAILLDCPEEAVELDLASAACRSGAGDSRRIGDVPIIDRLGEGTAAWTRRRRELLRKRG